MCVSSQRISSKQYDVWVIVRAFLDENQPGGEIMSGYCTCTAGLLGSCNHVIGLLFRIEAANIQGLTNPACTDILSKWEVPSKKKKVAPGKLSSFLIKKDKYGKDNTETRNKNTAKKLEFQVMSGSQKKKS